MDPQYLIGQVAARHNIRLEPDDPIFALVTMNEILLRDILDRSEAELRTQAAAIVDVVRKLESDTSQRLARDIRAAATLSRAAFQRDVTAACAQIRAATSGNRGISSRSEIQWSVFGGLIALLSFLCGLIVGKFVAIP